MPPAASRVALVGVLLMLLVAKLARSTKGAFPPGPASVALAVAVAFLDAARNGFAALAADPSLGAEDRARLSEAAALFRRASGVVATRMPGPRGAASVPSLAGLADGSAALADYFSTEAEGGPPAVAVDGPGRAAVEALRRDVLVLAAEPREGVLLLMEAAAAGVSFPAAPGGAAR